MNFFLYLKTGYFEEIIDTVSFKLNEKTHYQQYLDNFKILQDVSEDTGDVDGITTSIDFNNYSISDRLTINVSNFIDFSIFNKFKDTWYTWIRVATYIGLIIYNVNQIIKLFNGFGVVESSSRDTQNNVKGSDKK